MSHKSNPVLKKDIPAAISVFLVAVPLCLGIAVGSGVDPISGLIAGIVGGLVVGSLSGSHTSVAGPAAGLIAIVLAALADLATPELFFAAVALSGILQVGLGLIRAGGIAYYFPNAVIRGLLAAIGIILILKEIPHAIGYDSDPEGEMAFVQPDGDNTFTGIWHALERIELGAIIITLLCLAILILWNRSKRLKSLPVPAPLAAVLAGVVINLLFKELAPGIYLSGVHLVELPAFDSLTGLFDSLKRADFSGISDPAVWRVAVTLAVVASLETLLNLEAADKLDPHRRVSPPNRELMAQGVGNMVSGTLGGLPVTSVVIRSSVNVYAGAESRLSTIIHGGLLVVTVLFIPFVLAMIPLSALAAILLVTGFKLFNPRIVKNMWKRGFRQFMPFATTILAIVFTDLLIGIIIGLAVGLGFVLRGLITSPFIGKARARPDIGEPARFKLAPEVSFLHRAGLVRAFEDVEPGSELVIDASRTEHIDDDAVDIIRNFVNIQSKERDIGVSLLDFGGVIGGEPETKSYVNIFTRDRQLHHSGASALELLREGNERFVTGTTIERDYLRQVELTSEGQHPVAAVLGCIDSRAPAEIIFDKGIGDIFAVRVAGQVLNDDIIGSLEFAAAVANVHLILVLGHTRCGTIKAACKGKEFGHATGLLEKLQPSVEAIKSRSESFDPSSSVTIELVSRDNIERVMDEIPKRSELIRDLIAEGELIIAGGLYRVESGEVDFITSDDKPQAAAEQADG